MNRFDLTYETILAECYYTSSEVILTEGIVDSLFSGIKNIQFLNDIKELLSHFSSISAKLFSFIKSCLKKIAAFANLDVLEFMKNVLSEIKSKGSNKFFTLPLMVLLLSTCAAFSSSGAIQDHMDDKDYELVKSIMTSSKEEDRGVYEKMSDSKFDKIKEVLDAAIKKTADKRLRIDHSLLQKMKTDHDQKHFYYSESNDGDWLEVIEPMNGYAIEIDDNGKIESIVATSFDEALDIVRDAKMNRMDKRWLNPVKLYSTVNDKTMIINGMSKADLDTLREDLLKHRVA